MRSAELFFDAWLTSMAHSAVILVRCSSAPGRNRLNHVFDTVDRIYLPKGTLRTYLLYDW